MCIRVSGNTAAANGFGGVVKAVPGFATLTTMLLVIPGTPLISEAISVSVLAGATGSASGGMGIALEALGPKYMELAADVYKRQIIFIPMNTVFREAMS